MILSDVSIRRPIVCTVGCIILVVVGLLAFGRLPVREYPDTDTPVVSVTTIYPGAAAEVIETRITDPLEEQLSTIDGIRKMTSVSREQVSQITLEFTLDRNIDEAANDVRDRVGRARGRLPQEANDPTVAKSDADSRPFMWISVSSEFYDRIELTRFADRYGKRLLQTVPGVANVIIGGERRPAMRIWLLPERLAAFGLTAGDVERALREQNVEIPGGRIESEGLEFTVRLKGDLATEDEFSRIVVAATPTYQVELGEVARVELGARDYRTQTYFNQRPSVGLGVVRQSQSNLLDVADGVKTIIPEIQRQMPDGVQVILSYDASLFVERSVNEVIKTLFIAFSLVILVIFFFLRNPRATIIPLVTVPVSLIGTFAIMLAMGFTINILTLLALVLAVGLVIDDAIVMLENIYRRIEGGEDPIRAAFAGSRQVAFAIIATTLTLIAVFLPVAFQRGSTGRLFYEFGLTLAIAVSVSSIVALTLTPMLCSIALKGKRQDRGHSRFYQWTEKQLEGLTAFYSRCLGWCLKGWPLVMLFAVGFSAVGPILFLNLQRELVPTEDRGILISFFRGPLGATPDYTRHYIIKMEEIVADIPEVERNFSISAVAFGTPGVGNQGLMFTALSHWEDRDRSTQQIIGELAGRYAAEITGGLAFPIPIRPLGGGGGDFRFILTGQDFGELQQVGASMLDRMRESGLFNQPRVDPSPSKPQLDVRVDRRRAADLNVPVSVVATTLETLFGGREVTQFRQGNDQFDVVIQVDDARRASPEDLTRLYVRSTDGALIQLSNLVTYDETVIPENYPHFNRFRSVALVTQLAPGVSVGDGVAFLEELAQEILPPGMGYDWDGEAREYLEGVQATFFLFGFALVFTFLVLAAQFESWVHPVSIYSGVMMAISAGIIVLYLTQFTANPVTDNLFSRFGLIMLIGLVAKNGILIVEFANQLRVRGRDAYGAVTEAAALRFRPILMTAISTVFGILPLALATGAGAETRNALGIVVVGGLSVATFFSLFAVPVFYYALDRAVVALTGKSSARGLIRAREVEEQRKEAAAW
ncbi:MAG: efflux RND transporter permease subunit [Puniceicoccaceae bacterium]|nr:MAG: efflux RND transporter permease subunit [Puniceicoccaceae bacterium]